MAATWVHAGVRSVTSVQATTESAPTLATEGLDLSAVRSVRVFLEADTGQTLSGAGDVDLYVYGRTMEAWALAPFEPFTVPSDAAGARRVLVGTVRIDHSSGRMAPICRGVTVSGGGVTVYCEATQHAIFGAAEA